MHDRREQIKNYITDNLNVRVRELERLFPDVSAMTIRRDLAALEAEGCIIRTRGGARAAAQGMAEDDYGRREQANIEAKRAVGEKALALLEEKRSIFLDSGTTVMAMARHMPDLEYVLLTSAPNVAIEICTRKQRPRVTLLGGNLSRTTLSCSGRPALDDLRLVNIDLAFMATSGYTASGGFTSGNPYEAELKAEIIRKARRVIMLMTTDKIDRSLPYTFAQLSDVDVLVCEREPDAELRARAEECGVALL